MTVRARLCPLAAGPVSHRMIVARVTNDVAARWPAGGLRASETGPQNGSEYGAERRRRRGEKSFCCGRSPGLTRLEWHCYLGGFANGRSRWVRANFRDWSWPLPTGQSGATVPVLIFDNLVVVDGI